MKRFQLTLTRREPETKSFEINSIDTIEANDLVELASHLMLLIAQMHRRMMQEAEIEAMRQKAFKDNDIPF